MKQVESGVKVSVKRHVNTVGSGLTGWQVVTSVTLSLSDGNTGEAAREKESEQRERDREKPNQSTSKLQESKDH